MPYRVSRSVAGLLGGAIPALACLAAGRLLAAPPASPAPGALRQEILVTAALLRDEEEVLPASASVLDAADLERRQAAELREVLATTPGLHLATSGSPGHTTSAFSRGTNSNHTLVLWNGVPLNGAFEGRFDFAFLPAEGTERVEVVRGPWSALYGSGLGGVIHVVTGPGSGAGSGAQLSARLEAGNEGYRRGHLAAGGLLPASIRASGLALARRGEGGFRNDFYDGEDAQARLLGALGFSGRATWGLLTRVNRSRAGIPFDGLVPSPRAENEWRESQVAVPLHAVSARGSSLEILASRTTSRLDFRDPDSLFTTASTSRGETWRGRAVVGRSAAEGRHWWAAGGEWSGEAIDHREDFARLDDRTRDRSAAFVQARASAGSWSFEFGARHDEDQHFGGQTSPRAGVVRRLGANGRLHASYGESFRAPSFLDLYYPFYGNPNLEPETSRSVELGARGRIAGGDGTRASLRAGVVLFRNEVRDLIQGVPPTFQAGNVGRARTEGAEVDATVEHRRSGLRARLAVTLLETENLDSGARLLRRPRTSAALEAFWNVPGPASRRALQFGLVARHVGARDDFDPATFATRENPAFERLDLLAAAEVRARLRLFARVENATDRRYAEVLGFPAPGRTWIGGAGWRF